MSFGAPYLGVLLCGRDARNDGRRLYLHFVVIFNIKNLIGSHLIISEIMGGAHSATARLAFVGSQSILEGECYTSSTELHSDLSSIVPDA